MSVGFASDIEMASPDYDYNYDFFATNKRTWCFEPVNGQSGDAWTEEPGIRSVSAAKKNCYTTLTLECPFFEHIRLGNIL